jgi:hypothetical protein
MQHQSEPACPLHADRHGGHECDCPTLDCSKVDSGFLALFGTVGILPAVDEAFVPVDITGKTPAAIVFANSLAIVPPAPPPRI